MFYNIKMIDKNDIEELLDVWFKTKEEIAVLEKKCEKYKKYCEKILDNLEENNISSNDYSLKRINLTKGTISKKDVPSDIWKQYSREVTYPVYYLKAKKTIKPKIKTKKKEKTED
jgi:hypothetical protein